MVAAVTCQQIVSFAADLCEFSGMLHGLCLGRWTKPYSAIRRLSMASQNSIGTLVAAVAFTLLYGGLSFRAPVSRQRTADISLPGGKLTLFSASDIALVALVRFNQFSGHNDLLIDSPTRPCRAGSYA
jgi:hypothetical protein